jgi:hypothetical protein
MHLPINVKSPNNISKWQVGFNSAFKGLISVEKVFDDAVRHFGICVVVRSSSNKIRC